MTASLDQIAQQFAVPQKEYSPVPIWWWSGDQLEAGRLRWQMEQLIAGGIYNVIILNLAPTSPLYGSDPDRPAFMSEEWWTIFLGVCEDAKELGMRIWFYDQIGFSGANIQGGIVRDEPSYAGQALHSVTVEGQGILQLECPSEGIPIAAAYIPLDGHGQPTGSPVMLKLDGRTARTDSHGNKRLRLMYAIRRGFDYFNAKGCERLLDTIHREFERRAGQYFGDVIVGSFQDELPSMLTWSSQFAAAFQEIKGYDLHQQMIALWEGEDAHAEQVRVDYHQVRAELAERALFRPFFDWHRQHGLVCGFDQQSPARTGQPVGGVQQYADYMRTHRWYDIPGSDHHGNGKIHSSLAHLYERPRVWIESFHSSGWGGTLEETFDWLLPWLRNGATLYNPHAVYYSTWGGWWEWAPPSTCWRQPYWQHYSTFANTVSRLCFLLSQGSHVCDIGVLYPTTTVQSGLTIDDPLPSAQAANDAYIALTGTMMFLQMETGILDQDKRDFDVLDDASIQGGQSENGYLQIGDEQFKVIVLPACKVLESATAEQLTHFVTNGGMLIAIDVIPDHIIGATAEQCQAFRDLFDSGKAQSLPHPADLKNSLQKLPRTVEAPLPVLHRRIQGADVLFVPAASPHASQNTDNNDSSWLKANYDFDPSGYHNPMKIFVRGFNGTPQLWDAVSGERHTLAATQRDDGFEIEVPFDTAPAALIIWANAELDKTQAEENPSFIIELPSTWTATLEQTLDNRYGDFTKPDFAGAPPVQTWSFAHRIEQIGEDGFRDGWHEGQAAQGWSPVMATFGTYGWWSGIQPADQLPAPLTNLPADGQLAGENWQAAEYSLQRGIYKDELHIPNLGPNGHVPEEFLAFGQATAGQGIQFRTSLWMPEATSLHLALAAPARKQAWINGQALDPETSGYLWLTPIRLNAGLNLLEWRLTAEQDVDLRAYWALVTDLDAFARPERMMPTDKTLKDSRVSFSLEFDLPFSPITATIQVSADSPCRILVNDQEAGRQGGFDPYASLARVQPYTVTNFHAGKNQLVVQAQDIGLATAVLVDGIISGENDQQFLIMSGSQWSVQRDDGDLYPVALYRSQWLNPAWSHLWPRPHPLPEATWLENTPMKNTVLPVVPDASAGHPAVEWFSWQLPPGVREIHLPIAGKARFWIDGAECEIEHNTFHVPESDSTKRTAYLQVIPQHGRTGGGIFTEPVIYKTQSGAIQLGDWEAQGLGAYSGGIRYHNIFRLDTQPKQALVDLGRVRGTAEVWINGQKAGVRVWSPYKFDITSLTKVGENAVEILILNTLAPYLDAVSPTHYVRPGQKVSGLFGPVTIQMHT